MRLTRNNLRANPRQQQAWQNQCWNNLILTCCCEIWYIQKNLLLITDVIHCENTCIEWLTHGKKHTARTHKRNYQLNSLTFILHMCKRGWTYWFLSSKYHNTANKCYLKIGFVHALHINRCETNPYKGNIAHQPRFAAIAANVLHINHWLTHTQAHINAPTYNHGHRYKYTRTCNKLSMHSSRRIWPWNLSEIWPWNIRRTRPWNVRETRVKNT